MTDAIIAPMPPRDGGEWDCKCARCGSSADSQTCMQCCGDGYSGHDCGDDCCCCLEPDDDVLCGLCDGRGYWNRCLSSPEWCNANPLPGRESVQRGSIEWFHTAVQEERQR